MKKILLGVLFLLACSVTVHAQANHVVISEVYGGGGNGGSTYKNDFIELYNPTDIAVDLTGWSVQYASVTGSTWNNITILSGTIPAKGYYLVQEAAGTGGTTNLPTPDVTGTIAMAGGSGKVILCNVITVQSGINPTGANIIDKVGYGTGNNGYETAPTGTALSGGTSAERKANSMSTPASMTGLGADATAGNGYDTDNNLADFIIRAPEPQNSSVTEGAASNAPSIVLSPGSLSFGAQSINTSSAEKSFTITPSNLNNSDISLTASAPYSISKTPNGTYSGSLSYTAVDLSNGVPTVYVKFAPVATGNFASSISITGGGIAAAKTLVLSGAGSDPNQTVYDFNDCTTSLSTGFTAFSVIGAQQWSCISNFGRNSTNGININGYASGTNNINEDWLISPAFNLSSSTFPILSFYSRGEFSGPSLQLKVSTDYPGTGNPADYTWTTINGYFPDSGSNIWALSDNIDLSAYKQAGVYVAFVYHSTTTASSRWTLDDFAINNSTTPPAPILFNSDALLQYKYVATNTDSDKTTSISFANLTADAILTSNSTNFTISADGTTFSPTLTLPLNEINNTAKTITVRFKPTTSNTSYTALLNIASTGSAAKSIQLTGDTYDTEATLDVVNWNIEWFGSSSNGPTDKTIQNTNVKTILTNAGADIYGLTEIVSETALAALVAAMPGYSYAISDYGSYADNSNDADYANGQKLAYVYKTAMFSNVSTQGLMRCTEAVDCPAHDAWASGRFPYLLSADVSVNGLTQKVNFVLIHAKANTGSTDAEKITAYNRRKTGADLLKTVLDAAPYNLENVVILGDFNDALDKTIAPAPLTVTSYTSFVNDNTNYSSVTLPLSLAGLKSTTGFNTVIDNVIISNEMATNYVANSAGILTDLASTITNYASTTSDHYPVQTRYLFTSGTTLPIHLSSFTAKAGANKVELKWTTLSEENNNYFTVERSADGIKFTGVNKVKGANNSNAAISYISYDNQPLKGISYYRLKQTDFNGQSSYSDAKAVTVLSGMSSKLIISPNPGSNKVSLSIPNESKFLQLNVSRTDGQVIFNTSGTLDLLTQKLNADLSKWPAGIYFMQINDGLQVYTEKFMKE